MSAHTYSTIMLGALQTDWRESGTGAAGTVLMLHSLGLDSRAFDGIRDALTPNWRVVSFDQRGHGKAAGTQPQSLDELVDDACRAIDLCAVEHVHLVGHSMGGAIAALSAARLGLRVASLALIATPAAGHPVFNARAQAAIDQGMQAAVPATLKRWFGTEPAPSAADAVAYARAALSTMSPAGFAAAWRALACFEGYTSIASRLPRTAIIAGVRDLSTPPDAMRPIFDTFVAAGVEETPIFTRVEDAGHMLALTHPATVAEALRAHWHPAACRL